MKKNASLRKMLASALLLAIALVLKTFFSVNIPLFGQNGMTVGVSGIFSMMPSFLFGPWYGAAVSGLSDLLGYLLKPTGAYMPLLTLTAAMTGFVRGWIFRVFAKKQEKRLRIAVLVLGLILLIVGVANIILLQHDGVDNTFYDRCPPETVDSSGMSFVSRLLISRTINTKNPASNLATYVNTVSYCPVVCGGILLLVYVVELLLCKKKTAGKAGISVMAMLLAITISGSVNTTINTVILRETVYASWKLLPFGVVWVPRFVEELLAGFVKGCCIAVIMGLGVRKYLDKWEAEELPAKAGTNAASATGIQSEDPAAETKAETETESDISAKSE